MQRKSTGSDYSTGDSIGTVEIGIQYLSDSQKLIVEILRVFDLALKENGSNSDVFCKCTLMPNKLSFQTKVVENSSNPIFEEQFEFELVESTNLESNHLEISLFEFDKFSKGECIGICVVRLNFSNIEIKKIFLKDFKPNPKINEVIFLSLIIVKL